MSKYVELGMIHCHGDERRGSKWLGSWPLDYIFASRGRRVLQPARDYTRRILNREHKKFLAYSHFMDPL